PDGNWFAAVSAARSGFIPGTSAFFFPASNLGAGGDPNCNQIGQQVLLPSQAIAAAPLDATRFVVQVRDPAALVVYDVSTRATELVRSLSLTPTRTPGHDRFHVETSGGLACASCHPEGGDDGRV